VARSILGAPFTEVTIRLATIDDARAIAEIHVRSWQAGYRGLIPDPCLERLSIDDREVTWRKILCESGTGTRIAENEGRVLGWISSGANRDSDAGPEIGEIHALYVHPERWRGGVGRGLWEAAREALIAAGYSGATLWVLEDNERAQRFYQAIGFRIDPGAERFGERGDLVLREIRMRAALS
jgi:ribosomal protein S18 acetylase RimI-like enzyme